MSEQKLTRKWKEYTPEEENFIRENWRKMTDNKLASLLGRTSYGVKRCRLQLGLKRRRGAGWSKEKVIRKLKDLADRLDRTPVERDDRNLAGVARNHFGSWNAAKRAAGLKILKQSGKKWSKEKIVDRLRGLANELGRSPAIADDPNLASAAYAYFGSWNAAKEEAGLKTFSKGFPHGLDSDSYRSWKNKRVKMVELSIRISNLANPDEIEPLARKLAQLKGVNVGERPWDLHPSNLVNWAKSEARSTLKQYPQRYLRIQDGWAEETYKKMVGEEK